MDARRCPAGPSGWSPTRATLDGGDGRAEDLPPEERARRERSREQAGGVVGYATDRPVTMAAFALSGQLYVAELAAGLTPRLVETAGGVIDPRPDPHGQLVAFVAGGALLRARRRPPG